MSTLEAERVYGKGQEFVEHLIKDAPELHVMFQGDKLGSIKPEEFGFGYLCFSHMIPPFKPAKTLILGYGGGSVAGLMRKIWGPVDITGVDFNEVDNIYRESEIVLSDAFGYVKDCADSMIKKRFDYVVVDLFDDERVPEFVFSKEFAVNLKSITKRLLSINIMQDDFVKLKVYSDSGFDFHRFVPVFANNVSFWEPRHA